MIIEEGSLKALKILDIHDPSGMWEQLRQTIF